MLTFHLLVYIETKGPTLEEIAKLFDGDDAAVANVQLRGDKVVHGGDVTPELIAEKQATTHTESV